MIVTLALPAAWCFEAALTARTAVTPGLISLVNQHAAQAFQAAASSAGFNAASAISRPEVTGARYGGTPASSSLKALGMHAGTSS